MKGWLLRGCSLRRRRKTEGEGGSERVVTKGVLEKKEDRRGTRE